MSNGHTNPKTLTELALTLTNLHDAFESFCAPVFCDSVRNYSCTVDGAVVTSLLSVDLSPHRLSHRETFELRIQCIHGLNLNFCHVSCIHFIIENKNFLIKNVLITTLYRHS